MANKDRSFSNFAPHRHRLRDILKSKIDNFKMDIIGGLYEMNLSHLCYDIFSQLDSRSFANSRLVSKIWKNFIDYEFDKKKGRKWMKEKLRHNFVLLEGGFMPSNCGLKIHPFLDGISKDRILIDKDGICLMNDISGEIHMYDNPSFHMTKSLPSLELKWKRNFSSYTVNSMKIRHERFRCFPDDYDEDGHYKEYFIGYRYENRKVFDHVEMNEKRIFALIDKKKLFFICRETGQILHHMDQQMEKFGQFDNRYLYTLAPQDFNPNDSVYPEVFKILFYDITPKTPPIQIFASESNFLRIDINNCDNPLSIKEDKIVGIHCDEDCESFLVSWNITTGKEIFRVSLTKNIVGEYSKTLYELERDTYAFFFELHWGGILKWPYVGFKAYTRGEKPGYYGVFIIDATTGAGKRFKTDFDVKIYMDIWMVHRNEEYTFEFCEWIDWNISKKTNMMMMRSKYQCPFRSFRCCFQAVIGKILYLILLEESGIYLTKWNFWS